MIGQHRGADAGVTGRGLALPTEIRAIGRGQALDTPEIRIAKIGAYDGLVHALPGLDVAAVAGAGVAVVTRDGREDAPELRIAGVGRAEVVVIADDRGVGTTIHWMTGINRAGIVVVTIDWTVDALPGGSIAGVHGAGIVVVAILRDVDAADIRIAGIDGAEVAVIAVPGRDTARAGRRTGRLLAFVGGRRAIARVVAPAIRTSAGIGRAAETGGAIPILAADLTDFAFARGTGGFDSRRAQRTTDRSTEDDLQQRSTAARRSALREMIETPVIHLPPPHPATNAPRQRRTLTQRIHLTSSADLRDHDLTWAARPENIHTETFRTIAHAFSLGCCATDAVVITNSAIA